MGGGGLSIGGNHGKSRRPGDESGGGEGGGRAGKEGESGKVLSHGGSVGINGFGSSGKRKAGPHACSLSSGFLFFTVPSGRHQFVVASPSNSTFFFFMI